MILSNFYRDGSDYIWTTLQTLADKTGLSKRQVGIVLGNLESQFGLIKRTRASRGSKYQFFLMLQERDEAEFTGSKGRTQLRRGGEVYFGRVANSASPQVTNSASPYSETRKRLRVTQSDARPPSEAAARASDSDGNADAASDRCANCGGAKDAPDMRSCFPCLRAEAGLPREASRGRAEAGSTPDAASGVDADLGRALGGAG